MINCSENFQSIFLFVLLYLETVLDDIAAVLYVEAASAHFVLFIADDPIQSKSAFSSTLFEAVLSGAVSASTAVGS